MDLKRLFCIRGQDDLALHHQRRAYVIFPDLVEIGECIVVHHLHGFKKRAVGEYDEAEGFGIADTAHPAADGDCVLVHGFHIPVKGADRCEVHMGMSFHRIGGFPQAPDLYPAAMRLKAYWILYHIWHVLCKRFLNFFRSTGVRFAPRKAFSPGPVPGPLGLPDLSGGC